jgi:gliding motility-associated-like protein
LSYFVRVINKDRSITSSSNRVSFYSSQVPSPKYVYIKNASILDNTTSVVNILIDTTAYYSGLDILQSIDGYSFSSVGFVPNVGTSNYSFSIKNLETLKRSYYYKAILRDSCGNSRVESNICKTILLKVEQDKDYLFKQHLSWSKYEGFGAGVSRYQIYRVVNEQIDSSPIGSTPDTLTTFTDEVEDESSKGTKIQYFVKAIERAGNPYGVLSESNSNPVSIYLDGALFVPNAFAPNGLNQTWMPITHFVDKIDYHVRIFNRWGKLFFETNSDTQAWDGGSEPAGIYVYLIDYKNARGEYKEVKGTIMLIR